MYHKISGRCSISKGSKRLQVFIKEKASHLSEVTEGTLPDFARIS
jgi:hypothetical protein